MRTMLEPKWLKSYFANVSGMDSVKVAVTNIYNMQKNNKHRVELGQPMYSNNMLIVGPTGSGKSAAVDIVCKCYAEMGIAPSSTPIVTSYQALLSLTVSQTEENIANFLNNVTNQIVVIDHLEDFNDRYHYSSGFEMIDRIVNAYHASNHAFTIIATGEEPGVSEVLRKKRNLAELFEIPTVKLGVYSECELVEAMKKIAGTRGYAIASEACRLLLEEYEQNKDAENFDHMAMLKNRIVEASMNAASRSELTKHFDDRGFTLLELGDFQPHAMQTDSETLDELLAKLHGLIGLSEVKEHVKEMMASVEVSAEARKFGLDSTNATLHMAFTGAPGTGKTTVARLIGKIYAKMGILSKGQFIECTRKDLVASNTGRTAEKTNEMIEKALGGVLFIDEAYAVCRDSNDSFGQEALATLTDAIYKYRDNLVVILAGYDNEMEKFFAQNPGMKSRIPHIIHFENYNNVEMMEIFRKYVNDNGMILHMDAEADVKALLEQKSKYQDFGNARGVENVFQAIVKRHEKRLSSMGLSYLGETDYRLITKEDVEEYNKTNKAPSLQDWYEELESLTGLESVKTQVKQMANSIRMNQIRKERGMQTQNMPSLHMVFMGNAGTGKTMMARIIGNIYHELGVLPSGKVVECSRADVVAEYVGQTAPKMRNKIKEAQGGVLFIDEAYSLCEGKNESFGREAINELVQAMENYRENFMVIVAGYQDKMEQFLATNQGLSSRFSNKLVFEDYNQEELLFIFGEMLSASGLKMVTDPEAKQIIEKIMADATCQKDFGNARGVRNLVEALGKIQNDRLAEALDRGVILSDEELQQITKQDLEMLRSSI